MSASLTRHSPLLVLLFVSSAPALALAQTAVIEIEEEDEDVVVDGRPDDADTVTPAPPDEASELRRELATLRSRLEALEAARSAAAADTDAPAADAETEPPERVELIEELARWGITISGYVQAQYEWSDLSEDERLQGGALLNRNLFSVRRGRLRVAGAWEHFALELELDGSNTRGSFFGLRRTTVGVLLRNDDRALPPLAELTVGLTEVPFGYEVREGQRDWLFMERSLGSLAFFRGPLDLGVRARGGIGPFRYDVAVMSGTPLDDRAGQELAFDPTAAPDLAGRLGVESDRSPDVELGGGVSFLWGTGFHPGQDATKGRLEWRDSNESGTLDTGEIVAVPGRAATPSLTFERWGVNLDVHAGFRSPLGWTRFFVEATLASNLDRSYFVADPLVVGYDVREVAAYAAILQDVFEWGVVGFRYDYYDPNSDLIDQRRGLAVPADASIHTLSPLIGVRLPGDLVPGLGGRLVFQYDAILDALGRDARGVPADLKNDQFTIRVQGEFR